MKSICILFSLFPVLLFGQARLILNGGIVKISNAYVVIENSNPNAITRNAGYIDSEGPNNNISWNIGSQIGSYTVPFGNAANYIPVSYTKANNTGSGNFVFATYPTTTWENSVSLPAGITNFTNAAGLDNSKNVIDRFWKLEANFAAKPNLNNLQFTYIDGEHSVAQNTITEISLQAQRWNSSSMQWGDFPPAGTINTATNTLNIANLAAADLFSWWTLVSNNVMLPIGISDIKVDCQEQQRTISWKPNGSDSWLSLDLQVSETGEDWQTIKQFTNADAMQENMHYTYRAENEDNYYRLALTDENGERDFSEIAVSPCHKEKQDLLVFPNPSATGSVNIYFPSRGIYVLANSLGQKLMEWTVEEQDKTIIVNNLEPGVYYIRAEQESAKKITIIN